MTEETSSQLLRGSKTNDWVRSKINFLVGPQGPLLVTVKRRKLAWFGYVMHRDSLSKTLLQDVLEGGQRLDSLSKTLLQDVLEGGQHRGRQRKCWMDNVKEWTNLPMPELLTMAFHRKGWKEDLC